MRSTAVFLVIVSGAELLYSCLGRERKNPSHLNARVRRAALAPPALSAGDNNGD